MSAIGWQGRIVDASTEEAVALVCQEYLAFWTRERLAELPETCRPPRDLDSEDVCPYALRLVRQLGVGDRVTAPMLYTVTTFFTKAALRIAAIREHAAPAPSQRADSRPSTPGR